jgi:C-terminal domain 12 of the ABC-three component (ABC-3C) systems
MKYAYEDLSDDQFEALIVVLCQRLLGISTKGFAKGRDGGRDAKFVGTAELHPSKAAPWVGTTIIQAKHTNGYNRHFGETDFFSETSSSTVLAEEVVRIKKLREAGQLDHYMLFANRRLAGGVEQAIVQYISEKTGLPEASIYLCGIEQLEMFLKQWPEVAVLADLDPIDSPLLVSPDDLAIVVQAIAKNGDAIDEALSSSPVSRTSFEEKNKLNKMSKEYAKEQRKRYLKHTKQVQDFLADPQNADIKSTYLSVCEEFQLAIVSKRKDYQDFDSVMEYLARLLFDRDPILKQQAHKTLTRVVLFFMYWNCDIGQSAHAEA